MLTLKQLRDNREETIARLAKKGVEAAPIIDRIVALDDRRKALQAELEYISSDDAIEKRAREDLGLVGENEILVQID